MTRRHRTGLTGLMWLGATLAGCGGWVDLANPELDAGAESGGKSAAGGSSGGAATAPVPNGEGGELFNAAGAPASPAVEARFQFLEPPPPTLVPEGAGGEGVSWSGLASIVAGRLEDGVLLGSSEYCFKRVGSASPCEWLTNEPFLWSEAGGVVALGHLADLSGISSAYPLQVSADGRTVVGSYRAGQRIGFFRWNEATGITRLGEPLSTESGGPEHMSLDGTVISGLAKLATGGTKGSENGHQPFLWTVAAGYRALSSFGTWPAGAELVGMSADGSVLIGETSTEPKQIFRWSPVDGTELIETLPGSNNCRFVRSSSDAKVIFGSCQSSSDEAAGFVWTRAAGTTPLLDPATGAPCDVNPAAFAKKSTVVFGNAYCGAPPAKAVRWSAATGLSVLPPAATGRAEVSVNLDRSAVRSVAFGVLQPSSVSFPEEAQAGARAFIVTDAAGIVPLPPLAGDTFSYAYAVDAAAELVVGRSGSLGGTFGGTSSATLWDDLGAVGIAAQLTRLGLDLHGVPLFSGQRIAIDEHGAIIVQGTTDQQSGAWIAWLPRR